LSDMTTKNVRQTFSYEMSFLRERLSYILRRHIRQADINRTDHEFVLEVHKRYLKAREDYVLDPAE